MAVADFLNAPSFDEIDLSGYNGTPGIKIAIRVTDDFKVVEVQVEIYNGDGTLVESGAAVQQPNPVDWVFTAKVNNGSLDGDKVVIKASDVPRNISAYTHSV